MGGERVVFWGEGGKLMSSFFFPSKLILFINTAYMHIVMKLWSEASAEIIFPLPRNKGRKNLSENIHALQTPIPFQTISSSPLRNHLRLLRIPPFQQNPTRPIKKRSNDGQTSGNSVALYITGTLLRRIELRRNEIGDVCDGVGERHADGAFGIGREVRGDPCYGQGGDGVETCDEDEHACVAGVWIGCCHADEVAGCDGDAASDDEDAAFSEFVGEVDLNCEGDGAEDVDGDGHVVHF